MIFERFRRATAAEPVRVEPPVVAQPVAAVAEASGTAAPARWLTDIGWGGSLGGQSRVRTLPRVSPDTAQRHATVFACCNVIAGDLSKVPLKLYRRRDDGTEERVRDHAAAYLVNVEASPGVPAALMRYALVYAFCLRGNGYAYAPRDGSGELVMVETVRQGSVSVLRNGRARFYDFTDGEGMQRRAPSRSMLHLRYGAEDGWTGRSPLQVAAESVGIALAGQEAAARNASGITTKAVIKLSDNYEDNEAATRQARRIANSLRNPEDDTFPILGEGEDVKSLDISAGDQELLASRKFDALQLAALYRVPPFKLMQGADGVKANSEQQAMDYLTDCLMHWAGQVEAFYAMGLLTEGEREAGMFWRHDFGSLLRATTKERYEALTKAVGGPFMTWREARRVEGLADLEGDDRPYPPANMTRKDEKEGAE
ncbi:phage portal protein [Haematobacter massiliensis]|uniref:phage portal protein n=1 Tax=Haematobacter massiliensis TaxID=195105 RepID=UPI0023F3F20E|nr:phage portal protein [Haematobacter massiliensis]